jgi:hypothetical protein
VTRQDAAPAEDAAPVEEMHRPHRLTMLVAALAMVVTAWLLSGSAAEGWRYLVGGLRTPEGTERIQHAADQVGAGLLLIGALAQAVRASGQAPKSARARDNLDLFGWACVVAGALFALLALI